MESPESARKAQTDSGYRHVARDNTRASSVPAPSVAGLRLSEPFFINATAVPENEATRGCTSQTHTIVGFTSEKCRRRGERRAVNLAAIVTK